MMTAPYNHPGILAHKVDKKYAGMQAMAKNRKDKRTSLEFKWKCRILSRKTPKQANRNQPLYWK
jgi:hypothetical protein